jgi:mannose-6-phosphate isomerase-like protein (cupin superfamily)
MHADGLCREGQEGRRMMRRVCVEPSKDTVSRIRVEEIALAPGEEIKEVHGLADESFYYMVSGYALLTADVYGYALEPQVGIYIPPRTNHAVQNTGGVDCVIVRYGFAP